MPRDPIGEAISSLQDTVQDIINGVYVIPTALGPNQLSKASIKAKSITGTNISVTDLSAVNTKTGNLNVNGNLTVSAGGSFRSGKTSYSDVANAGYWMGIDSGVTKIRVGDIGGANGFTWDGTSLAILGSITATTGTIGGWTIGSTSLQDSTGGVGLASSGSIRFWSGNTTPSSAPFRVDSGGAMTSTSGSIGGWTIDSTGIRLGSGGTARGMDSGSTAFYAGGATPSSAPFNVTTAGAVSCSNLTVTGGSVKADTINTGNLAFGSTGTVNTGGTVSGTIGNSGGTLNLGALTVAGTITLGGGGKIIDSDGSFWDQNGITLKSSGTFGDVLTWNVSSTDIGSITASSSNLIIYSSTGKNIDIRCGTGVTPDAELYLPSNHQWILQSSLGSIQVDSSGRILASGNIFPQGQTTYYVGSSSSLQLAGPVDFLNHTTAGSTANWSTAGPATSYITVKIGGTNRRIPFYADA